MRKILAIVGALASLSAFAQADYPERPIHVIVPFAAGGSVDVVARAVAKPMGEKFDQAVIVENKPGASGMIGSAYVAKAKPDGYTLLANSSIHVIVPSLYPKISYDALEDFRPVSQTTLVPLVLLADPKLPVDDFPGFLKWAKAQDDGVNYASAGQGSTPHLAAEMLGEAAGFKVTHIPYKGSGAAMVDVMGGEVPIMFDALTAVMSHIKGGSLIALAVGSEERSPLLPDVPTFKELGYPQLEMNTWHGFWAPKGTSDSVVNKLSSELQQITHLPQVTDLIQSLGGTPVGGTPEEFDAFIRMEREKWDGMVKRFDVTVD